MIYLDPIAVTQGDPFTTNIAWVPEGGTTNMAGWSGIVRVVKTTFGDVIGEWPVDVSVAGTITVSFPDTSFFPSLARIGSFVTCTYEITITGPGGAVEILQGSVAVAGRAIGAATAGGCYVSGDPLADVEAARQAAVSTAADRVQTGLDRAQTEADAAATADDATATAADRVQTTADRVQTMADAADTALDAAAVAADRVLAEAAREGAVLAAATVGFYADTTLAAAKTAGLAVTTEGQTFHATGADVDYVGVYKDVSGVAVEQSRYPTAARVAAVEADIRLTELQLGRPLSENYTSGSVGTDVPNTSALGAGVFAPLALQPTQSVLSAVRVRLKTAGTYEIHAYHRLTDTTWEVVAVWPGTAASTGLMTLTAGGGVIPDRHVVEAGDFVAISVGTARIAYAAGTNWVNVVSDTGLGSVVTRNVNTNGYDIAIAYDFATVSDNVEARMGALEVSEAAATLVVGAVNNGILLAPVGAGLPLGYADTGAEMLGCRLIAPDRTAALSAAFDGTEGFALLPTSAALYQDAAWVTAADAVDDPVFAVADLAPVPSVITAVGDTNRPTLKSDGAARFLRFDGSNDRMTYPASVINTGALTFVCSVALRSTGSFPQVIGDVSTSLGLFCGFDSAGKPRFSAGGQAVLSATAAVTLGQRVTLSFVYDGANRYIYQDGALVASAVTTGAFTLGSQPLICYSGANVTVSPIDLYGAVLVGRALSTDEREAVEALVASDWATVSGPALQSAVAKARRAMMLDFGAFFGMLSSVGTKSYALGDSTVASYAGGTALMGLIDCSRTEVDLSVPGHTIAQQQTAWTAQTIVEADVGWVIVQVGLNDLNPAEAASVAIARLQTLVTTIRGEIGARKLLISQMIPCRARLISVYGGTDGPVAYAKWQAMNEAIAGGGGTPITGVDGRITAHVPVMNDGSGNLRPEYDTGDGIHPNTAGRMVNASVWEDALVAAGLVV